MAFQKVVVVTWQKLQWCHGKSYIRDMANAMKNIFCHGKVVLNFHSGEKVVKHFFPQKKYVQHGKICSGDMANGILEAWKKL